jgi:hypothetical protein
VSRFLDGLTRQICAFLPVAAGVIYAVMIVGVLGLLTPEPLSVPAHLNAHKIEELSWALLKSLSAYTFAGGSIAVFVSDVRARVAHNDAKRVEAEERKRQAQARIDRL